MTRRTCCVACEGTDDGAMWCRVQARGYNCATHGPGDREIAAHGYRDGTSGALIDALVDRYGISREQADRIVDHIDLGVESGVFS